VLRVFYFEYLNEFST